MKKNNPPDQFGINHFEGLVDHLWGKKQYFEKISSNLILKSPTHEHSLEEYIEAIDESVAFPYWLGSIPRDMLLKELSYILGDLSGGAGMLYKEDLRDSIKDVFFPLSIKD